MRLLRPILIALASELSFIARHLESPLPAPTVGNYIDMARTVKAQHDARTLAKFARIAVTDSPMSEELLQGKRLFYSALQPMVGRRWISCSSCHVDGETGLAYVRARSVDVRAEGTAQAPRVAAALVARSLRAPGSKDPLDLDKNGQRIDPGILASIDKPNVTAAAVIDLELFKNARRRRFCNRDLANRHIGNILH